MPPVLVKTIHNKKSRTYGTSDLSISISFAKNHMRDPLP